MGFGIENFAMLVQKGGKLHITEAVELSNPLNAGRKVSLQYLETLVADTIK